MALLTAKYFRRISPWHFLIFAKQLSAMFVFIVCFTLAVSAAQASGGSTEDDESSPPPPPPASCPEQDNIFYTNPNSIGDCIHPQLIQSRTTHYYYPDSNGGCFHWKTVASNYSYQCIKPDYHYECSSGECSFYQYLAYHYGYGQNTVVTVENNTTVETWASTAYSINSFSQQKTYSSIRNNLTGITLDVLTHDFISETEDTYFHSDPDRNAIRLGNVEIRINGNIHKSLQIEQSDEWVLCHSNTQVDPAEEIRFSSFMTLRNLTVHEESEYTIGGQSTRTSSDEWQRDTGTPNNVCEVYESFSALEDPESAESDFHYYWTSEGNYSGWESTADGVYEAIKDDRR